MVSGISGFSLVFSYVTLAVAIVLFLASVVALIALRGKLPVWAKAILIVVAVLCGLYLALILVLVIAFGHHDQGHPIGRPYP